MDSSAVLFTVDGTGNVAPNTYAAGIITCVLATVAVVLRYWSRYLSASRFGWDDFLVSLAYVLALAEFGIILWWLHLGGGKYIGAVTADKLRQVFLAIFITELIYPLCMFLARAAVLALWTRLFPQKSVRWYCWTWRVLNIFWAIAGVAVPLGQCKPLWTVWEPLAAGANYTKLCKVDVKRLYLALGISGPLIDLAIIVVPLILCWRLQLNRSAKILICGMFATSFFVTVVSGSRIVSITRANLQDPMKVLNATWTFDKVGLWSLVEMNISIVCACLPCLRPVIAKIVPTGMVPKSLQRGRLPPALHHGRDTDYTSGHTSQGNSEKFVSKAGLTDSSGWTHISRVDSTISSERRDAVSDAENGIVETPTKASGTLSWLKPHQSGSRTPVHGQRRDTEKPDGIVVEHSFEIHSANQSEVEQ